MTSVFMVSRRQLIVTCAWHASRAITRVLELPVLCPTPLRWLYLIDSPALDTMMKASHHLPWHKVQL